MYNQTSLVQHPVGLELDNKSFYKCRLAELWASTILFQKVYVYFVETPSHINTNCIRRVPLKSTYCRYYSLQWTNTSVYRFEFVGVGAYYVRQSCYNTYTYESERIIA